MKLVTLRNGRPIVMLDAQRDPRHPPLVGTAPEEQREIGDGPELFTARGYRQTSKTAFAGGKANGAGIRVRNAGMSALAASFDGKPFISGHDWEDVRARGGTIKDARIEEIDDGAELAILYDIEAVTAWAKEGFANGMIDRFSFGIDLAAGAEIICTAHGAPIWSVEGCLCLPGQTVTVASKDPDHPPLVGVAEWEYENAVGHELSAVNVPAVEGTGILSLGDRDEFVEQIAQLVGRRPGVSSRSVAVPVAIVTPAAPIDVATIAATLGLDPGASLDDLRAIVAERDRNRTRIAELERDATRTHAEHELGRLAASHQVPGDVLAHLLSAAGDRGREAFDRELELVRRTALERVPVRARLQSDASPAMRPGAGHPYFGDDVDRNNAFDEIASTDPQTHIEVLRMARLAEVTPEEMRKHGSHWVFVPNLQELINNSTEEPSAVMKVQASVGVGK